MKHQDQPQVNSIVTVKKHTKLRQVTEEEFRANSAQVYKDADNGTQTAITAPDGKTVRTVIGLNGFRFLPDQPDPLEMIERAAVRLKKGETQK